MTCYVSSGTLNPTHSLTLRCILKLAAAESYCVISLLRCFTFLIFWVTLLLGALMHVCHVCHRSFPTLPNGAQDTDHFIHSAFFTFVIVQLEDESEELVYYR